MGISSYSGRTTLSSKVLEKLIDEGSLLDKLDPDFLVPTSALGKRFGLWPEDQEIINVPTLAEFFTQLTHLPRLHGAQVLPECFAKGVQRGLFAYALGDGEKKKFDTIYFGDKSITGDRSSRQPRRSFSPPGTSNGFSSSVPANGLAGTARSTAIARR